MVSNHAKGKKLVGDILQISTEARKQKQINPNVIDATVGALYDENAQFYKFNTVDTLIRNLSDNEFYTYSPSDGGNEYRDAVLKWVFQNERQYVIDNMHCQVIATAGGTGAVSNAIYNSCDPGDIILLPDLFWGPYKNMAITNDLKIEYYPLLAENKFNINDFIKMANNIIVTQNKFATIINDPCNNPAGYSLTNEELHTVIDFMNSMPETKFSLIYDIAYFDFSFLGMAKTREKFRILANAKENVIVNICFSASKSFSIYGFRTGAQIILGKDKEAVDTLYYSSCYLARTRWSNVTKAGISLLVKITKNENFYQAVIAEIEKAKELLYLRAATLIKEAEAVNLEIYPYSGGFFMTIPVNNSNDVFESLKKEGIYTLPFKNAIRVSISALPISDIKGLALKIKKTMTS